jgi:hypothetical protein
MFCHLAINTDKEECTATHTIPTLLVLAVPHAPTTLKQSIIKVKFMVLV